jgi:hypothetical protein
MSEPKFTKGPWEVDLSSPLDPKVATSLGGWIATELDWPLSPVAADANAHLIAAAPELYAALERLVDRLDSHFGGPSRSSDWEEQEDARKALAKARGEVSDA